jgi:hypothetical protein
MTSITETPGQENITNLKTSKGDNSDGRTIAQLKSKRYLKKRPARNFLAGRFIS